MADNFRNLIIMRGLPGSGKSHAAKNFGGFVLSTDNYFMVDGVYQFNPTKIGQAHAETQLLTKACMEWLTPLLVIDNTNIRLWEMKPYLLLAKEYNYKVSFAYPETPWANDPEECAKRNTHGVPLESVVRMHNNFEHFRSLDEILNATTPMPRVTN